MLEIRKVEKEDKECWLSIDQHIPEEEFYSKVDNQTGYIIWKAGNPIGVLHFNLF